jgi:hypothetical protein
MPEPLTSPPPSPSMHDLRQRVLSGQPVSDAEYAQVIESLRKKRSGDITAAAEKPSAQGIAKVAKVKKETKALDDILGGLFPSKKEL